MFIKKAENEAFHIFPKVKSLSSCEVLSIEKDIIKDNSILKEEYSIYISIPFCNVKCNSCSYFKGIITDSNDYILENYVKLIIKQIQSYIFLKKNKNKICKSIYFGGGTASLLSITNIEKILITLYKTFNVDINCEITLEGNPKDFNLEYLINCRNLGINRLSIGYQTSNERLLENIINSPHNETESKEVLNIAKKSGFNNINIDMLYALPTQSFEEWKEDLTYIISHKPTSITFYSYNIYSWSKMNKLITSNKLPKPIDKLEKEVWYNYALELFKENGYLSKRRSSVFQKGFEQKYGYHNYKKCDDLIGIGLGSYGFINGRQIINTLSFKEYENLLKVGSFSTAKAISNKCTNLELMRRYIIFNLSDSNIETNMFKKRFNIDIFDKFSILNDLIKDEYLYFVNSYIGFTNKGLSWRNNILNLFYKEELY